MPSSVISSQSMHLGVLATASHALLTQSLFVVYYKPRTSQFIIGLNKYLDVVKNGYTVGVRFKMRLEVEESPERRFASTIIGVKDISSQWECSKWRYLKVQWDEPASVTRSERVSPWEIEPFVASEPSGISQTVNLKNKRPRHPTKTPSLEPAASTVSAIWNPSHDSHDSSQLNGTLEGQMSDNNVYRQSMQSTKYSILTNESNNLARASRNKMSHEIKNNKSAWSVPQSYINQIPAHHSNDISPMTINEKKSDSDGTCRLFGFDLKSSLTDVAAKVPL